MSDAFDDNLTDDGADAQPLFAAGKRVRIILEENDDIPPTGHYVGINGKGYLIRPGEEVLVPPGVVEVLQHAITLVPTVDPNTRQVSGYRERMRLPFRIIG